MKRLNLSSAIYLFIILFSIQVTACNKKPKDEDIQKSVSDQLSTNPSYSGVTATVKDGVVTLDGKCEGENCDTAIIEEVKKIEGVDNVESNITKSGTDLTLRTSVQTIISKYQGVQADVAAGVIVLRGSISRDQLQPLMAELNNLQPQKIDNQLAVQ